MAVDKHESRRFLWNPKRRQDLAYCRILTDFQFKAASILVPRHLASRHLASSNLAPKNLALRSVFAQ